MSVFSVNIWTPKEMMLPSGVLDPKHFQTWTYLDDLTPLFKPGATCEKQNRMTVSLSPLNFPSGTLDCSLRIARQVTMHNFCFVTYWQTGSVALTQHHTSGDSKKHTNKHAEPGGSTTYFQSESRRFKFQYTDKKEHPLHEKQNIMI